MSFPVYWTVQQYVWACFMHRTDRRQAHGCMVITVGDVSEKPLQQRTSPSH